MSDSRDELKRSLRQYISVIFTDIQTVTGFISRSSDWIEKRDEKSKKMRRTEKDPENSPRDEAGLKEGLESTLRGLKEMQIFLEAVEKLAVTSAHVFDHNHVLHLSEETDLESVKRIISVCQIICPLLLSFKRDNEAFFSPKLENLEVMQVQLNQYITNIKHMCGVFRQGSLTDLCVDKNSVEVDLSEVSEGDIKQMLLHLNELQKIREDEPFRMVSLFQDKHKPFMEEFRLRKKRMLQFLEDVEACAVNLDEITTGARLSNVAGSSVGVLGGGLFIIGLALIPVTFGVSMGLLGVGVGLGVLSGANTVATISTEKEVGSAEKKKAEDTFEKFMEDMNSLQKCLNDVIEQHFENIQENSTTQNLMANDCVSVFKGGNIIGKDAEVGGEVTKGLVAIGKVAKGGFIAVNVLFLGVDIFLIVHNSIDLYIGAPNNTSEFIRARAALWKSEIDSMQEICDSLEEGQQQYENKKEQLQTPFYESRARV